MYVVLTYEEQTAVTEAKKAMNNYFLESNLLKVKVGVFSPGDIPKTEKNIG